MTSGAHANIVSSLTTPWSCGTVNGSTWRNLSTISGFSLAAKGDNGDIKRLPSQLDLGTGGDLCATAKVGTCCKRATAKLPNCGKPL